ncbi:hypothetical protein MTO96_031764, partial [Rhipicephalus appendiculatus]
SSNGAETKLPVPEEVRRQTRTDPIPKNMNPEYNKGRRVVGAKALIDLHVNDEHAQYVDSANTNGTPSQRLSLKRRPVQRGRQRA